MQNLTFALIDENMVKNRFECDNYELANQLAKASYGSKAFAIETTRFITKIGDCYENGLFYHILEDGNKMEVEYVPTEQEKISQLQNNLLKTQLVITESYEGNLSIENNLLLLQQIITEFYEKMEDIK